MNFICKFCRIRSYDFNKNQKNSNNKLTNFKKYTTLKISFLTFFDNFKEVVYERLANSNKGIVIIIG